jgi:hypothetical protein
MEEADGMKQATVTEGNGGQASQLTEERKDSFELGGSSDSTKGSEIEA